MINGRIEYQGFFFFSGRDTKTNYKKGKNEKESGRQ